MWVSVSLTKQKTLPIVQCSKSRWACDTEGAILPIESLRLNFFTTNLFSEISSANFMHLLCNLCLHNAPGICPVQQREKYTCTVLSVQVVTA